MNRIAPERVRRQQCILSGLVLLEAFALLIGSRLTLPLLEPEEALYAVLPRDMLAEGQFVVPVLRGEPYLDKPPLLYWLVMGCYRAFGVHVWSARLVPTLAAWLTVLVVFAWGRVCGGREVGLTCAAVLTLTCDFVYRGPMLTPNGLLGLLTTTGLALGHLALRYERVQLGWWIASAFFTGLAVLTKGPVGLVLVGTPLFVLPRIVRGFARPGGQALLIYVGTVTLVAAPWFFAVTTRHPEFAEYFFWKHNFQRFASPFDHAKPVHYYLPQILLGGLPWTIMTATQFMGSTDARSSVRLSADSRFALITACIWFAFFSLSGSKRPAYLLPLWPVVAIGVGTTLARAHPASATEGVRLSKKVWVWAVWVVSAALLLGVLLWLPVYHRQFSLGEAGEVIARSPGVTVFCYPHPWNSLDFSLGRTSTVFGDGHQSLLMDQVCHAGSAVVVVKHGTSSRELVAAIPDGLEVQERWEAGQVTVLLIRRRISAR